MYGVPQPLLGTQQQALTRQGPAIPPRLGCLRMPVVHPVIEETGFVALQSFFKTSHEEIGDRLVEDDPGIIPTRGARVLVEMYQRFFKSSKANQANGQVLVQDG